MLRMPSKWILLAAIGLAVLGVQRADAECSVQTPNGSATSLISTPTAPVGQSFVACQDGLITNIAVWVGLATQPSMRLGLQAGTDLLAPEYTAIRDSPLGAPRILFMPGFPVSNGTLYSLSLTPVTGIINMPQAAAASYPDGTALQVVQGASVPQNSDLQFSVTITEPAVPAAFATWGGLKSIYR